MRQAWDRVYRRLLVDFSQSDARRMTNLVLACAHSSGKKRKILDKYLISDFANEVSEALFFSSHVSYEVFEGLAGFQLATDQSSLNRSSLDQWVEAFQAADESRKSLGAFSTPAPFADILAKQALISKGSNTPNRIVDPSSGTGALLIAMLCALVKQGVPPYQAVARLYGVEVDPVARELSVLLLWLFVPEDTRPQLSDIAKRVVLDNALSKNWWVDGQGYDVVITNPPWESLRHSRDNDKDEKLRLETLARLERPQPGSAGLPPLYSAHGRGDRNLFKAFVELYPHLLSRGGILSALIPAAFGSDLGMMDLRRLYFSNMSIKRWSSFENQSKLFPIDSRYKFGILLATKTRDGTKKYVTRSFCSQPQDVERKHIVIHCSELERIGGAELVLPELTDRMEKDILLKMLANGWKLLQPGLFGEVSYRREVDLTLGRRSGKFLHVSEKDTFPKQGNDLFRECRNQFAPLLEGRMVGQYDCFQKSYVSGAGRSALWVHNGENPVEDCRPQFVSRALYGSRHRIALCDVTSATNTRTVLATCVPHTWLCGNTAPVLNFSTEQSMFAALTILNSLVFDWMTRRIVSGLHLNKFYLQQLRWPNLGKEDAQRLSSLGRVLCRLHPRGGLEIQPSEAKESSRGTEITMRLAQVEEIVARGYGITHKELDYMLSPDTSHRRGFWRYYNTTGHAAEVRSLALSLMER